MRLPHVVFPLVVAFVIATDAGEELWQRGQRAEAIESWSALLAKRPEDAGLRLRLVRAELSTHRYQAALEHARALGDAGRAERGAALYRLSRYAEALAELSRESEDELLMRIDAALLVTGAFAGARADAAELEKRGFAGTARAQATLGRIAVLEGERASAERHFRRALELDPVDRTALFGLGKLRMDAGDETEGELLLQRHRKVVPLLDQLDFAQRSVDLAPSHGPNHAAVGDAQRALGRIDDATKAYELAETWCRPEELAPVVLRHARLLAEDRKDARAAVLLLDRSFEKVQDVRLLVRAGDVLAQQRDVEGARARLRKALELRPNDQEIRARLEKLESAK